ncbi:hypothetical protein I203_103610 [Kwoniella mangroviensis CBS 8507]|uniref:uncharacterized protein n=1 Tax=Kwoniella mangroviensis CBS 8507 TaxID=1296122 RepID=UPI00080CDFB5|nr:uncharacterized protein I203_04293 [Kwoniella mangroviensis CBS 8507]OCF66717.1 hypothetical protein I203_04293 [Kwoniella mangroviensis CBS 8507]
MIPGSLTYSLFYLVAILLLAQAAMADSNPKSNPNSDTNLPGAPLFSPDGKTHKCIPHEQVLEILSSTAPVRTPEGQDAFYNSEGWYLLTETPENTQKILDSGEDHSITLKPGQGHK